jgi:small-conductance mechanosensitive channel
MTTSFKYSFLLPLLSLFLMCSMFCRAQDEPFKPSETLPSIDNTAEPPLPGIDEIQRIDPLEGITDPRMRSLLQIASSAEQVSLELHRKQQQLESDEGIGRLDELTSDVGELSERLEFLRREFAQIAGGQELPGKQVQPSEYSWSAEIRDLLAPLIDALKDLTAQSRKIHALNEQITLQEIRIKKSKEALKRIQRSAGPQALQEPLARAHAVWKKLLEEARTERSIASEKLKNLTAGQRTFTENLQELFHTFFRTRGFNLILAFGCSGIFFVLLGRARTFKFFSKLGTSTRVFQLLASTVLLLGTITIFLGVLFLMQDWLLLTLAGLLLFGILWTAKDTIPKFWAQAMLLLNLGPVREGERVIKDGISLRVRSLGVQVILDNPLLNGDYRLPLSDLLQLRSRRTIEEEPWFPTNANDWIFWQGTYAQVVLQTPETVILNEPGGAVLTVPTAKFIGADIRNISQGFRVYITFGIGYGHQAAAVDDVPKRIHDQLRKKLEHESLVAHVKNLVVEFESAGASALNLAVIMDCSGELAGQYDRLSRFLQRSCVEICSSENWEIPFNQLRVHLPAA